MRQWKFIFIFGYIFLVVRIWALWFDRPFIMVDIEDKFILLLSTNILSMAILGLCWSLVAKYTVCNRLYVNNDSRCFFFSLLYKDVSLHLDFLYKLIKMFCGILYLLDTINLYDLVTSSTAGISRSFSWHLPEILILLKYRYLQTKIHTPHFCRLTGETWS
jgi:hypothetical protein